MATDPVCGMWVDERSSTLRLARDNRIYYFCSETCLREFADPERSQRQLARRIVVAWPLAVGVVVLTYAVGSRDAILLAAALATVVQFYAGWAFYSGARDAIVDRSWNMDLLIAVGSTAAYLYSLAALLVPGRLPASFYFDASSLIITLILTGHYLERLTRARAGSALRRLGELLPSTATLVRGDREVTVPVSEVKVGDLVRVRPGGRVPTDGVVRTGSSAINEALLTGESMPVTKERGDRVIAASVNGPGLLEVEATAVGADTFVAQIGRLLTDAEMSRVPIQRLADRIAAVFVPFVLAVGAAAGLGWVIVGHADPTIGLLVFVSVVITACPCAFGIATPAAIVVGTGRAAQGGVLFRGEDAIERASRVSLVVADKTGTLTEGRATLTDVRPLGGASALDVLALAAAVESGSEHPLAQAVIEAARARGAPSRTASGIRVDPGRGVFGAVDTEAIAIVPSGDPDLAGAEGLDPRALEELETGGRTVSVVLRKGRPIGVLGFSDPVRSGVREAVRALREEGVATVMATGDGPGAAARVATAVGIEEVHSRLDPNAKLQLLKDLRQRGETVAFVGDGVNDAPALAAADLGIAVGSGSDIAREAGAVVLVRSDFGGVPLALRIARRTVAKVRGNLLWALGYNAVLLPVAAGALVPIFGLGQYAVLPVVGAVAMAASSTLVVANSLSLRSIAIAARPVPSIGA
ncbi:MAG: heavy metal translocating P-type ATPase [Thermoplasmata archaeon]